MLGTLRTWSPDMLEREEAVEIAETARGFGLWIYDFGWFEAKRGSRAEFPYKIGIENRETGERFLARTRAEAAEGLASMGFTLGEKKTELDRVICELPW